MVAKGWFMSRVRKTTPSHKKIIEYWTSEEGYKRHKEVKKYAPSYFKEDSYKTIYLPVDTDSPACFACDKPTPAWHKHLERCHILPWSITENQNVDNFILMCKDCHRASPTITNEEYFWKWVRDREHYNTQSQSMFSNYVSSDDVQKYTGHLFSVYEHKSFLFDLTILDNLKELSEVVPVAGKIADSALTIKMIEVVKYPSTTPSKLFNIDETMTFFEKKEQLLDDDNYEEYYDLIDDYSSDYQKRLDKYNQLSEQQQKQRIEELKRFNNEESKAFIDVEALCGRMRVQ